MGFNIAWFVAVGIAGLFLAIQFLLPERRRQTVGVVLLIASSGLILSPLWLRLLLNAPTFQMSRPVWAFLLVLLAGFGIRYSSAHIWLGDRFRRGPRLLVQNFTTTPLPMGPAPEPCYGRGLSVRNVEQRFDTTAHNVTATFELRHVTGERRRSTGIWLADHTWVHRASFLMSGNSIILPLYYWCQNAGERYQYHLVGAAAMNVNPYGIMLGVSGSMPLQYGRWDVKVKLAGDNISGTWTTTVTLDPTGAGLSSEPKKRWF